MLAHSAGLFEEEMVTTSGFAILGSLLELIPQECFTTDTITRLETFCLSLVKIYGPKSDLFVDVLKNVLFNFSIWIRTPMLVQSKVIQMISTLATDIPEVRRDDSRRSRVSLCVGGDSLLLQAKENSSHTTLAIVAKILPRTYPFQVLHEVIGINSFIDIVKYFYWLQPIANKRLQVDPSALENRLSNNDLIGIRLSLLNLARYQHYLLNDFQRMCIS